MSIVRKQRRGTKSEIESTVIPLSEMIHEYENDDMYLGGNSGNVKMVGKKEVGYNLGLFNPLADGVTDESLLVQQIVTKANTNGVNILHIPKDVVYDIDSLILPVGFQIVDMTGLSNNPKERVMDNNASNVSNSRQITRRSTQTGGTPGYVNSALKVETETNKDLTSYEWSLVSVLDNYSDAGENVAIYGQGNKRSTGITWGGVFEAKDHQGILGNGLIGVEVNIFANGVDTTTRKGIDFVYGKTEPAGSPVQVYAGIELHPFNNDSNQGTMLNGIKMSGNISTGINIEGSLTNVMDIDASGATFGFLMKGDYVVGIDFSTATVTAQVLRMAANQQIAFEATGGITMEYDAGADAIQFKKSGVVKQTLSMA